MSFRYWRKLAVCLVVALAMTACGGGRGDGAPAPAPTYSLGGTVTGLNGTLVLQASGAQNLSLSSNGNFKFNTTYPSGASYAVTIATSPSGQTCSVTNGSGVFSNGSISNVAVACSNNGTNSVSIDNSVPAPASTAITTFVTGAESVPSTATSINVPAGVIAGQSILMATDASGNVFLLGYPAQDGSFTLSTASTARALALIGLEPLPQSLSATQITNAITGSAEYPTLVSTIATALAAKTPPASSSAVQASLSVLVSQAQSALGAQAPVTSTITALPSSRQRAFGARPQEAAPPPLPYTFPDIKSPNGSTIIALNDKSGDGVLLSNYSAVEWEASTLDTYGNTLATAMLPAQSVFGILAQGAISGALTPVPITGNNTQFLVQVEQGSGTVKFNMINALQTIVQGTLKDVVTLSGADQTCVGGTITTLVNGELPDLIAKHDANSVTAYLLGLFSPTEVDDTTKTLFKCIGLTAAESEAITTYAAVVAAVQLTTKTATVTSIVQQQALWWGTSAEVEICKFNGTLVQCSLTIYAPSLFLPVGQSEQLVPQLAGQAYVDPSDLTWTTSTPTLITVASDGQVAAGPTTGQASIQVADPYKDLGSITLTIGLPLIAPSAPTASAGETVQLMLVDPTGKALTLNPPWQWTSNSPSIATVDADSGLATAVASGIATMIAQDPLTKATTEPVKFTVTGFATSTEVSDDPMSLPDEGGTVTFTARVSSASAPADAPAMTGTVKFTDQSGNILCSTAIPVASGTARCTAAISFPTGYATNTVTAAYSGDAVYGPSSGSIAVTSLYPTTTTLTANPSSVPASGGSVTFTATISAATSVASGTPVPSQSVTFTDQSGAILCASIPLAAGTASCTASSIVPADTVTAAYSGDADYGPSTGTVTVISLYPTTTTLSANPSSVAASGGSVTFTATVRATSGVASGTPAPSQSVTFTDQSGAPLCTDVTLVSGSATCVASAIVPPDTITASYSGDAHYGSSTGTITISAAGTFAGTLQGTLPFTGFEFACTPATNAPCCPSSANPVICTTNNVAFAVTIDAYGDVAQIPGAFATNCALCSEYGSGTDWDLSAASVTPCTTSTSASPCQVGTATVQLTYYQDGAGYPDNLDYCQITVVLVPGQSGVTPTAKSGSLCNYLGKGVQSTLSTDTGPPAVTFTAN
jgi:Bacterial Ig-like domain (group 3)